MYPKTNNKPQQNTADNKASEAGREEIRAENRNVLVNQLGNEGMNDFLNSSFDPDMLRQANEDNMIDIEGREDFEDKKEDIKNENAGSRSGVGEKINILPEKSNPSEKKEIEDAKESEENNIIKDNDAGSDSGGKIKIISENSNPAEKKKVKEAKKLEDEIIEKDIIHEKDPVKIIEKAPDQLLDVVADGLEIADPEPERDMVVQAPKRKKKNGVDQPAVEDISDDMKPAAGFPFQPVKIAKRKKPGRSDRFLTGLAYYSGQTVGKTLAVALNLFYWVVLHLPYTGFMKLTGRAKNKLRIKPEEFQDVRRHDQISGWGGRKFQEQVTGERAENDPIDVDFRKIPGVWAELTAGQAEDKNGNPLKPVITIYVSEPEEKTDNTYARDIGHTFIGLEFSHFSKASNRFERYITKYGLFAPGGETASSYIAGLHKNATVPAQLLNDRDYSYKISQSFPAEPWQVNAIMKASETYADKGYRLFERNCTTFVRDMVINTAHIKAAEHILKSEEILMTNTMNLGVFGSAAFSMNASLGMKHTFEELGAQDDMSYERMGNKRFTKEEYDRYHESLKGGTDWQKYGMSPNTAAENMRRVKNPDAGLINALNYKGAPGDGRNHSYSLEDISRAYEKDSSELNIKLREITPEEMLANPDVPDEFVRIFSSFMTMMSPVDDLISKIMDEREANNITDIKKIEEYNCITLQLLRDTRKDLMSNIKDLNTLLFKYYQNDDRIHLPVLHLIALLNKGVQAVDKAYSGKMKIPGNPDNLGKAMQAMEGEKKEVTAGGAAVFITGSHYESYLQIFKTPEIAVAKYKRLLDLKEKKRTREGVTKAEKAELAKLERIETLADNFDRAHRYMLDKHGHRQQDIDYAFSLGVQEKKDGAEGDLFDEHGTAADVYKAAFLEKIFGGMPQRIMRDLNNNVFTVAQLGEANNMVDWLDEDMNAAALRKMNGMRMILKGLKRSLENPDRDKMFDAVQKLCCRPDSCSSAWIGKKDFPG